MQDAERRFYYPRAHKMDDCREVWPSIYFSISEDDLHDSTEGRSVSIVT